MQYDPKRRKQEDKEPLKPVISGGAKVKKKSSIEKAGGALLEEDVRSAVDYSVKNVFIPAAKRVIYDLFMNILGVSMFGENGAPKITSGGYSSGSGVNAGRVSYNNFSNNQQRNYRASVSDGFDYDRIVYPTAGDAEIVLDSMRDALDRGYIVTVWDLYDLSNVSTTNYLAKKYEWTDLRTARVVRAVDGWGIVLPKPIPVE